MDWVANKSARRNVQRSNTYWFYGSPEIGKPSIAHSICASLHERNHLAGAFFCRRDDPNLSEPINILPTFIHKLAMIFPPFRTIVAQHLRDDPNLTPESMKGSLFLDFIRCLPRHPKRTLAFVIDAFNECGDPQSRPGILKVLTDAAAQAPWLKIIIVTSRTEVDIQHFFNSLNQSSYLPHDLAAVQEPSNELRTSALSQFDSVSHVPRTGSRRLLWRNTLDDSESADESNRKHREAHHRANVIEPLILQPATTGHLDDSESVDERNGRNREDQDASTDLPAFARRQPDSVASVSHGSRTGLRLLMRMNKLDDSETVDESNRRYWEAHRANAVEPFILPPPTTRHLGGSQSADERNRRNREDQDASTDLLAFARRQLDSVASVSHGPQALLRSLMRRNNLDDSESADKSNRRYWEAHRANAVEPFILPPPMTRHLGGSQSADKRNREDQNASTDLLAFARRQPDSVAPVSHGSRTGLRRLMRRSNVDVSESVDENNRRYWEAHRANAIEPFILPPPTNG